MIFWLKQETLGRYFFMLALVEALWKKVLMYFGLLLLFYDHPGKTTRTNQPCMRMNAFQDMKTILHLLVVCFFLVQQRKLNLPQPSYAR